MPDGTVFFQSVLDGSCFILISCGGVNCSLLLISSSGSVLSAVWTPNPVLAIFLGVSSSPFMSIVGGTGGLLLPVCHSSPLPALGLVRIASATASRAPSSAFVAAWTLPLVHYLILKGLRDYPKSHWAFRLNLPPMAIYRLKVAISLLRS